MKILVYCGTNPDKDQKWLDVAKSVGKWIAESGHTLVTRGANSGMQGALIDGALESGGRVIGSVMEFEYFQKRKHPGITEWIEDRPRDYDNEMDAMAEAIIALPGGTHVLTSVTDSVFFRIANHKDFCPIVFFNAMGIYEQLDAHFKKLMDNEFMDPAVYSKMLFSDNFDEIGKFLEAEVKNS